MAEESDEVKPPKPRVPKADEPVEPVKYVLGDRPVFSAGILGEKLIGHIVERRNKGKRKREDTGDII